MQFYIQILEAAGPYRPLAFPPCLGLAYASFGCIQILQMLLAFEVSVKFVEMEQRRTNLVK